MSKYGAPGTATGQVFVPKAVETIATALAAPVVSFEDLKKLESTINLTELSGKREGSVVIAKATDGKWYICVAEDDLPKSKWNCVELNTPILPTAA